MKQIRVRVLCAALLFALTGCAVVSQLPSLKYCDSVSYTREGREINITAHCFEAVESMIPLPMPVKP